jgi:hypothetical protein
VNAALRAELAEATASSELHTLVAEFPEDTDEILQDGDDLESNWTKIKVQFGQGSASLSVQIVLAPKILEAGEIDEASWHFLIRVRELGRVTYSGEDWVHWSARIVLGTGDFENGGVVIVVPDHRAVWPACREVHANHTISINDPLLHELRATGRLTWRAAVRVQDAGAPLVEAERYYDDDCC